MSRLYDVEIEVKNVGKATYQMVFQLIDKELFDSLANVSFEAKEDADQGLIYGRDQTVLSGGESPEEAHKRITEAVKKVARDVAVTTKWHYAEWHDWDEIYED